MKAFTEKEQGFILSRKRGELLRRDCIGRIRQDLRYLWLLGRITKKESDYLNFELDKILYNVLKGGLKTNG